VTERGRVLLVAAVASILAVLAPAGALVAHRGSGDRAAASTDERGAGTVTPGSSASAAPTPTAEAAGTAAVPATLPGGRTKVFGGGRFLVAYYGTAGTGALGVLGRTSPDRMQRQLAHAGKAFAREGRPVQLVYELIVSIADGHPGKDGDYSHDITRKQVRPYLEAAHRNNALLLLDIQSGRSDFLKVAKRWRWALADPWVGLALDPEWRMGRHGVPGRVIGHVRAAEVNRTSAWLARLTERRHLPEKLFVLHQFRTAMIDHLDRVARRPGLAMVQHVDGFGTPREKRATFHAVVRPKRFTLGFKLFYRADVHRMSARDVFRLRPKVRFVSFQ
jgi:hypothetical protein